MMEVLAVEVVLVVLVLLVLEIQALVVLEEMLGLMAPRDKVVLVV